MNDTQNLEQRTESIRIQIMQRYEALGTITTSKAVLKIARPLLKLMPEDEDEFIDLCDELMQTREWIMLQLITTWIKTRKTLYQMKYFSTYQDWLYNYANDWGSCDILCYRVLNPMVEKFPKLYQTVKRWAISDKIYTRRASAVCLLNSSGFSFSVHVPFEWVEQICNIHKQDKHIHIQKGIGWLLKYAYLTYPVRTEKYLRSNLSILSRTTYRYALEKMEPEKRSYYMKLTNPSKK